jgi:hypothetical protein
MFKTIRDYKCDKTYDSLFDMIYEYFDDLIDNNYLKNTIYEHV